MIIDSAIVDVCHNGRCVTTTLYHLHKAWQNRAKSPYYLRGSQWNVVTWCAAGGQRRVVQIKLMSGRTLLVTPDQPVAGPARLLRPGQVVQTETGEDQVLWMMTCGVRPVIGIDAACYANGILIG